MLVSKQAADAAHLDFVNAWADGLELVYSGVDLPDSMAYDLLTIMGRAYLNAPPETQEKADDQANTPS